MSTSSSVPVITPESIQSGSTKDAVETQTDRIDWKGIWKGDHRGKRRRTTLGGNADRNTRQNSSTGRIVKRFKKFNEPEYDEVSPLVRR